MKVIKSGFNLNWFEFKFDSSLNIDKVDKGTISIFPNPVFNDIHINLSNQGVIKRINFFDITGRLIKEISASKHNGIYNLSDIKSGIYFMVLETDQGRFQKRIIKK